MYNNIHTRLLIIGLTMAFFAAGGAGRLAAMDIGDYESPGKDIFSQAAPETGFLPEFRPRVGGLHEPARPVGELGKYFGLSLVSFRGFGDMMLPYRATNALGLPFGKFGLSLRFGLAGSAQVYRSGVIKGQEARGLLIGFLPYGAIGWAFHSPGLGRFKPFLRYENGFMLNEGQVTAGNGKVTARASSLDGAAGFRGGLGYSLPYESMKKVEFIFEGGYLGAFEKVSGHFVMIGLGVAYNVY